MCYDPWKVALSGIALEFKAACDHSEARGTPPWPLRGPVPGDKAQPQVDVAHMLLKSINPTKSEQPH
jgi:hypothetical protein